MEIQGLLKIVPFSQAYQAEVKDFVLEGLAEHFGFLDTTLNPDLNDIMGHYTNQGHVFLVGLIGDEAVCCGALVPFDKATGRIVRMSVKKAYRRNRYASQIIQALEEEARRRDYSYIMLKTLAHWTDAVGFYTRQGFTTARLEGESVVMTKPL